MPRSRVTIRDVARYAGVSHQTVSRVINNSERVLPTTRERVEEAISALGYIPNEVARSMARGRTRMLACFSSSLVDYTFASIIQNAEREARSQGYFLITASAPDEETFAELVEQLITTRRVEGLMVFNPYADERHTLLPVNLPILFVGAHPCEGNSVSSIKLDDVGVAQEATQHLIDLGHRTIAMVSGPMKEKPSQDRCEGYRMALQQAQLEFHPHLVIEGDWSASTGYDALKQMAEAGQVPTAVFAQNDRMAIGVLRAARELKLIVPDQLAVIGVDDMPLSRYFDPPLTTMQQDLKAIGTQAAQLLIQAVEEPHKAHQHLYVSANLIERNSTRPHQP